LLRALVDAHVEAHSVKRAAGRREEQRKRQ